MRLTFLFALLITMSAKSIAQEVHCYFTLQTENQREVIAATNELMNSEFGKNLPCAVVLYAEMFNGEQNYTHTLGFIFPDAATMQKTYMAWFASPDVMKWEQKVNPVSDNVSEVLAVPAIQGGDISKDRCFMRFALSVNNEGSYAKLYKEYTDNAKARGMDMGSYGLGAIVAGTGEGEMTHYAYIGAPDIPTLMKRMQALKADAKFKDFASKAAPLRSVLHQDMLMVVQSWSPTMPKE